MRHEPSTGFSFELLDGWRRDEHILPITFFGPAGHIGWTEQVIQLEIGGIAAQYREPEAREEFLNEPGATAQRTIVGGERNAVVLRKPSNSELSVVRDGIHYSFSYSHDSETHRAIQMIKATARFPTAENAASKLRTSSDPITQATSAILRGKVPVLGPPHASPPKKARAGFITRFLRLFRSEPPVQKCETEACLHQMQVIGFGRSGGVTISPNDPSGVGPAEQCWECGSLYCMECYPSRPRNTCVCGRGQDAVRVIGGTVYRGSLRLVKVRYVK